MFRLVTNQIFFSLVLLCGLGFAFAGTPSLGSLEAQFCNNGQITKDLDLVTRAGQKLDFCIEYTNNSSEAVLLSLDFLDSIVTDDAFKRRACNAADRPKTQFGNYMLPYATGLSLSGNSKAQVHYYIQFPIGFAGISHGCLAYSIPGVQQTLQGENTQFAVVVRNIKFIDIYVGETQVDDSLSLSSPVFRTDSYGLHYIEFYLENKGNIAQRIGLSGMLDNFLGYQKKFAFSGILLQAHEKRFFSTQELGSYYLPFYKGFFRVRLSVSHVPQYVFDIDSPTHITKVTSPGIDVFTRFLVIYNWQFFVAVLFVISIVILISLAFFKKRKVIVVLK